MYAKLIVLIKKYFELSVVTATHSPYFADAINLFSLMNLAKMEERLLGMKLFEGYLFKDVHTYTKELF